MRRLAGAVAAAAALVLAGAAGPAAAEEATVTTITGTQSGVVVVPANTILRGAQGARLIGRVVLSEGSSVENLEITGWTDRQWNFSAGVRIAGDNATVRNCYIHDGPSHGVQVTGGYSGAKILNNKIVKVGAYQEVPGSKYPVANWRGVDLSPGSNGALVSGNLIDDAWENGVFEYGSAGVRIEKNTIRYFDRGHLEKWNAGSGNGIESASPGTVIRGNKINGARASRPTKSGGRSGIVANGKGAIVAGNAIVNTRESGIEIQQGATGRRVEGNTIRDVGFGSKGGAGIWLRVWSGPAQLGTIVMNNDIDRVGSGIAVRSGPNGKVDRATVRSNKLHSLKLSLVGKKNSIGGNTQVQGLLLERVEGEGGGAGAGSLVVVGLIALMAGAAAGRFSRRRPAVNAAPSFGPASVASGLSDAAANGAPAGNGGRSTMHATNGEESGKTRGGTPTQWRGTDVAGAIGVLLMVAGIARVIRRGLRDDD